MAQSYVSNRNESVRMFKSDLMEFFSHVHPVTPLVLYLPVIGYMLYVAFLENKLSILAVAGLFLFGVLIWTLLEYIIHRYVFHYEPKSHFGIRLHFMFHGVYLVYPNDGRRLVMPPSVSVPLAIVFWVLFAITFGRFAPAVSAGFGFGYIFYYSIFFSLLNYSLFKVVFS